jgi:hypothetical protein
MQISWSNTSLKSFDKQKYEHIVSLNAKGELL